MPVSHAPADRMIHLQDNVGSIKFADTYFDRPESRQHPYSLAGLRFSYALRKGIGDGNVVFEWYPHSAT